jgi:hypothetical protein
MVKLLGRPRKELPNLPVRSGIERLDDAELVRPLLRVRGTGRALNKTPPQLILAHQVPASANGSYS